MFSFEQMYLPWVFSKSTLYYSAVNIVADRAVSMGMSSQNENRETSLSENLQLLPHPPLLKFYRRIDKGLEASSIPRRGKSLCEVNESR